MKQQKSKMQACYAHTQIKEKKQNSIQMNHNNIQNKSGFTQTFTKKTPQERNKNNPRCINKNHKV